MSASSNGLMRLPGRRLLAAVRNTLPRDELFAGLGRRRRKLRADFFPQDVLLWVSHPLRY